MTDLKTLRIAVLGAGAVGGYIGGLLADAGYRVALVGAWAEHVDRINAEGLRLSDPLGSVVVRAEAMHLRLRCDHGRQGRAAGTHPCHAHRIGQTGGAR